VIVTLLLEALNGVADVRVTEESVRETVDEEIEIVDPRPLTVTEPNEISMGELLQEAELELIVRAPELRSQIADDIGPTARKLLKSY
jgi:hypothetical protein